MLKLQLLARTLLIYTDTGKKTLNEIIANDFAKICYSKKGESDLMKRLKVMLIIMLFSIHN
jgi:hypothetical protein